MLVAGYNNLKEYMDCVTDDCEVLLVIRKDNRNAIMLSEEDYRNQQEFLYLSESISNYRWLAESLDQMNGSQSQIMSGFDKPVIFSGNATTDYVIWQAEDKRTAEKIDGMLKEIASGGSRVQGCSLQGDFRGYWSRRINEYDRLIYKVDPLNVYVLACKYHCK